MRLLWFLAIVSVLEICYGLSCKEVVIPVQAKADNKLLPPETNASSLGIGYFLHGLVHSLDTSLISGKYNIAGRYCEPSVDVEKRRDTLQILVHGITYTRDYWSGLIGPNHKSPFGTTKYSWVHYASQQGYPTLSVDRLCNGKSSHPDALKECQLPLEAETMYKVVKAARGGKIPGVSQKFKKIVYAGHSYGSLVANGMAIRHPDDNAGIDSFLLTGFTGSLSFGGGTVVSNPKWLPSKLVEPQPNTESDDPNYIQATSKPGASRLYYYGAIKDKVANRDWAGRHTVTWGELATALLGQDKAPGYTGSVFVLNGMHDNIFCVPVPGEPTVSAKGQCVRKGGKDRTAAVSNLFPGASAFGSLNIPDTGHCLHLHDTAQQGFKAAHDFLEQQGF